MRKTSRLIYIAAGQPPGEGDLKGICRACDSEGLGVDFSKWVRPTFTNWDDLTPGSIICHACQFCFAERSELLAQRVGKEKPQRMRNYSHFVVDGEWIPLSKGDKAKMADILLHREPSVTIVAQSGQKHIIFRAIPGVVQFEEQQIQNWSGLGSMLTTVETLYDGFSKSEIKSGDYAQHHILKFGLSFWNELEKVLRPRRQTALFELALFMAQRKGDEDGRTEQNAPEGGGDVGRGVAGHPVQLQIPL